MRLTRNQWMAISDLAMGAAEGATGSRRMRKLLLRLGFLGATAAEEGVDPVRGPARFQIIHALRALVAEVNRLNGSVLDDDFLKVVLQAETVLDQCERGSKV